MSYTCESCAYWHPDTTATQTKRSAWGECRRSSPRLQLDRSDPTNSSAVWPPVSAMDWCGEMRPATMPLPLDMAAMDLRTEGRADG